MSYSTGLELSPRPRTCMGALLATAAGGAAGATAATAATGGGTRGRLDKSQSTPAYDLGGAAPGALVTQVIPESPTRAHAAPSPAATPAATPSDTPADRYVCRDTRSAHCPRASPRRPTTLRTIGLAN